ncbi:hypothetical protein V6Z12_A07G176700 [Gossypium hirsutum]
MTGHTWPHDRASFRYQPSSNRRRSSKNILHLLGKREVSPRTKYVPKKQWGEAPKRIVYSSPWTEPIRDARRGILSWAEEESLLHLSGKYCPLVPPPRSTIAAAFSPDGRTLASTHGDHTVKIIDYQKGKCLKVLSGHRRTPWVVRFHPVHPEILASGSLDHEVRLWDAKTAECLGSRDFYRPIASLAFHAEGELLAVACGHKLYIWDYNKNGEGSSPAIILKTRRSLRAVHFHPHAAPFLLTAEVNDLDSSDSSMTKATSQGYFHHHPPAVFVTCGQSSDQAGHSPPMQFQTDTTMGEQYNSTASPMEAVPPIPSHLYSGSENLVNTSVAFRMETGAAEPSFNAMVTDEIQPIRETEEPNSTNRSSYSSAQRGVPRHVSDRQDAREFRPLLQFLPLRAICWELPFLQGWVMGQQTTFPSMRPHSDTGHENLTQYTGSSSILQPLVGNVEAAASSLGISNSISQSGVFGRIGLQNITRSRLVSETGEVPVPSNSLHDGTDAERIISRLQSELATSMAVAAAAELPCTVKLKVWSYDIENPCALLNVGKCRLTIPHAVLCR